MVTKLNRDQVLELHRAGRQPLKHALFEPLGNAIMTAVSRLTTPRATVMRKGNPPVLSLTYATSQDRVVLVAQTNDTMLRLDLRAGHADGLSIVGQWAISKDTEGRLTVMGTPAIRGALGQLYSLRPSSVTDHLVFTAPSDSPDLVLTIVGEIQGYLATQG